jgi:hypothetical protein
MPIKPPPPATPAATTQVTGLSQQVQLNAGAGVFTGVHWADTTEGAILVDLIPNPKRYLIAEVFGIKVAMDCGTPEVHI